MKGLNRNHIMLLSPAILFLSILALASMRLPYDAGSLTPASLKKPIRWAVQESSTIRVEGESNVSNFSCDIDGYYQADTLVCYTGASRPNLVMLKGSLKIDLLAFNCHNRIITNDMRKTLKAEAFPQLIIHFISLERLPVFDGNTDIVKGLVNIELAGVTKKFEILYSFIKPGNAEVLLNGGRSFNFSDFNVKPPRRLAGMIKIRNEFSVIFKLSLVPF